ncbi:unnamed protein product (macronuclear) [Paramecium tetraurelia]|uniref:G-protein coupled receptors family 1 profile domain-containing protein n=1 Tax=Paramecium tetraurelia TaxID=5888 RepID=A0CIU2_PARTE|nr:uncharacterized protein GSPATT00007844001 [Paramecium tetraurelia]CAK70709.1 unnamed protein product [Paramecium tetraurelia]|eukprot:XP_001438106.1 hypothetical protein (macronuclear) [Paramecium tetraurelia strain d4-2]
MQQSDKYQIVRVIVIILCLLSMIGCSLILWTLFKTPRLSKNPGSIIQRMAIAQIIITFLMLFAQFYIDHVSNNDVSAAFIISTNFCSFIGFIEIFFSSEYILYNVYFPINLYFSLKTQNYNFTKYFTLMEIIFLMFSFIFTLTMVFVKDVKINFVGVCGLLLQDMSKVFGSILAIITIGVLILLILIALEKSSFKTTIYNKDSEKFHRKYHKEFKIVNILYTTVFLVSYMIPTCLMFWNQLNTSQSEHYYIFPIIYPLGGILLFLIRINDPIVKKYLYNVLIGKKKNQNQKLKDKLLQNQDFNIIDQISIESGLEISVCNNKKLRYTVKQVLSEKQIQSDITLSSPFGSGFQPKLIKGNQDLFIILLSIKNAINQCIGQTSYSLKNLKPFHFNHITKYQLFLQDDSKEMDQKYKNFNNLCLKDYVNEICYKRVINCYSYASNTLIHLFSQILNIHLDQLRTSLRIEQNTKKIVNTKLPTSYGPIFLTYDNYFSIEIISKQHKLLLTKGGGLMNICKRYQTEYSKSKNGNTLLPAILGLYTIQIEEDKFINVVLKLNQLKINYPLQINQISIPEEQDHLIQQDVFGWIQLSLEKGQFKLFIAEKLFDDRFQIRIEDNDFKLSKSAAQDLLTTLSKDIEEFCFFRNLTLSLVYFKLPTNRLDSMCKHENSLSYHYQLIKNSQQMTPLQMNEYFKGLGQFELDSKIGFVRIYIDNFWQEWEYIQENERCLYFDKLTEQLSEMI